MPLCSATDRLSGYSVSQSKVIFFVPTLKLSIEHYISVFIIFAPIVLIARDMLINFFYLFGSTDSVYYSPLRQEYYSYMSRVNEFRK